MAFFILSIFFTFSAIIAIVNYMDHNTTFFLSILTKFGWLGNWLFLFIALIECIPIVGGFFPGGTLISIAGFFAAQGYFNVWDVILFSIIGAIIGDYSGYILGRWGSNWLIRKKIVKQEFIDKGEAFFKRHGNKSIFWGRFIGATRAVIPFAAGSSKMSASSFFFWNSLSAVGWAFYNVGIGYFSGNIISVILKKGSHRLWIIIGIIIIGLIIYWVIYKKGQSIWSYFVKKSQQFTENLFNHTWFKNFSIRYPLVSEFFQTKVSQEKIFGGFWGAIILIILYILVLILDLI